MTERLFDDQEDIARGGEVEHETGQPQISEAECKRRESKGSAFLKQHGDDANGNPLDLNGKPVASQDLMTAGRRVSERYNAPRPEFVSEAALHGGVKLHSEPEAQIDMKRRHRVALQGFYKACTAICEDSGRHARIEAGLKLIVDAQSDFEIEIIAGAIRRDCKILGISTPAELAVAMGCSTSTVYTRLSDGSLTSAIVAVAAERQQNFSDAKQSRGLKPNIRLATKGTMFDSPAWHREIERLYASLKYEILTVLARETTLSRFSSQKSDDRSIRMLPQSRIELLGELGLLTPAVCRLLGRMTEAERDEWLAQRDAESIAELCGDVDQRRDWSTDTEDYAQRIKAYLQANGPLPTSNASKATCRKPKKDSRVNVPCLTQRRLNADNVREL